MVADAYDAVSVLPGVRRTSVVLEDHFASDAINDGVAAQAGFVRSFDGEAVAELDGLRADFPRKAVIAGTDQVCRPLLAAGKDQAALLPMRLGEGPPSRALTPVRGRRGATRPPPRAAAPTSTSCWARGTSGCTRRCRTSWATRTRAGCTRSAPASFSNDTATP